MKIQRKCEKSNQEKCWAMLKNGNYALRLQNNKKSLEEAGFEPTIVCTEV